MTKSFSTIKNYHLIIGLLKFIINNAVLIASSSFVFFFGIIFVINIVLLLKKIGYEKIIRIGSGFVIVCRH